MDVHYKKSVLLTGATVLYVVQHSKWLDIYNNAPYFVSTTHLGICNTHIQVLFIHRRYVKLAFIF